MKGKLVADIVGHIFKEISRAAWFFSERGGKADRKVFKEKHSPYPITKVGLEIMLSMELKIVDKRRKILEHFKEIIPSNYLENADTNSYQINDLAVINLQNEVFRESQENDKVKGL